MSATAISLALQRVKSVLQRRPSTGLHDDAPATARWQGGTRVSTQHDSGRQLLTDMPSELGGSGDQVTPGWLFRGGLASCTATCIALQAEASGIELQELEVQVRSRSDTRGLLGVAGAAGTAVYAGPCDMQMSIRISARGVTAGALRALVEESYRRSPVARAVLDPMPVTLSVEVGA